MSPTEALKAAIRAEARSRRAAVPLDARTAGADAVAEHGLAFLGPIGTRIVSGFSAIGDEIDPAPLLNKLAAAGVTLALPAVRSTNAALTFRAWAPGDEVQRGRWGILEPMPHAPVVRPHIVLLPLLAFDRTGGRIGYGGGFYDRSLHELRASGEVAAVGLAFDEQEVDVVPRLVYDELMNWVLTPSGPIPCRGN